MNDENPISLYAKCLNIPIKTVRMCLRNDKKLVSYGLIDNDGEITADAKNCIYDAPGSGKTQFARSLVHSLGLQTLIFKNELEVSNDDSEENPLCRLNSLLSLHKKDSVIIVDEAEGILKTQGSFFGMTFSLPQKGIVNRMLEESNNKVIWILNYTHELDESTRRRFTYSIKFSEMSRSMLKTIADTKLNKINMSTKLHSELVDLCGKYRVTGASVDNMVKTVSAMDLNGTNDGQIVSDVKKVLESNSTLIYGKKKMRENVRSSYDLSVLNTSIPAENIVDMVMNAQEFDEADSFFTDRSNARTSWERTTVNEFLTQMEEFSGILICTTNLRQIMDPAMQRRFHILTEFKPLRRDGIEKLLSHFFGSYNFDEEQLSAIAKYNSVTPGDFGSLSGKIRFMPRNAITSELIVSELCKIQEEKESNNKPIGFTR